MSPDNRTHHMIPFYIAGDGYLICAYCGLSAATIGPEPTQRPCPHATKPLEPREWQSTARRTIHDLPPL